MKVIDPADVQLVPARKVHAMTAPAHAPSGKVRVLAAETPRERQPWELEVERDQNSKRADHLEGQFRRAANGKMTPEQVTFGANCIRERAMTGDHVGALVDADAMLQSSGLPALE